MRIILQQVKRGGQDHPAPFGRGSASSIKRGVPTNS
jgi:hypothetical protein